MFTSRKNDEISDRAKRLGALGYFVKPFNPKGLATFLRGVAAGRIQGGEPPA